MGVDDFDRRYVHLLHPAYVPSDPVENMIAQMQSRSGNMDPAEMEALRQQLRIQFGLDGTLLEQYGYFLLHGLCSLTLARL